MSFERFGMVGRCAHLQPWRDDAGLPRRRATAVGARTDAPERAESAAARAATAGAAPTCRWKRTRGAGNKIFGATRG